ncbi:mediator of RNA polymerase II transcription subunit 30-like isoform X2 [Aphidius gifuensis]|uniref:mediator of RNA polymerase II transcription subunit 30-like isoform X2 n=1 Tax=Aphidius gifuensis TaxID=684658 RepID=UPI001CDC3B98|nr:mediator of RNA polymerase II transcription subunit 30-like isoform X2 [Aphidius gifuensis]
MSGQQHPFPSGFPTAQQQAMRSQFGGGQMVPGMVSPQQFNVGGNSMVMSNAQQQQQQQQLAVQQSVSMQMQQLQQQQQQLQQQQQQMQMQQQQQQANLVAQGNQPIGQVGQPSQAPISQTHQQPQQQPQQSGQSDQSQQQQSQQQQPQTHQTGQQPQNKEYNAITLCKFGQETVQEILMRVVECFSTLKTLQLPNGTAQGANIAKEKKIKFVEQLRTCSYLFRRLRVIYERSNETGQLQGMEYTHIESLIPLKEEWDMKSEEKKTSEAYRIAYEEYKEATEQVIAKNRHLKEIINQMRRLISEINTMLSMRRS